MEPVKVYEKVAYQFNKKEVNIPYTAKEGHPVENFVKKMKKKGFNLLKTDYSDIKIITLTFEKGETPYFDTESELEYDPY